MIFMLMFNDRNGGRPMTEEEEEDEQIDDFVRFLS